MLALKFPGIGNEKFPGIPGARESGFLGMDSLASRPHAAVAKLTQIDGEPR